MVNIKREAAKKATTYYCNLIGWEIVGDLEWVDNNGKRYLEDNAGTKYYANGLVSSNGVKKLWHKGEYLAIVGKFIAELESNDLPL